MNDLEPFVMALKELGRIDLAKDVLDTFSTIASNYEQYDNLAKCYFMLRLYSDSIKYSEHTLSLAASSQQFHTARANLINVYNHANYPEKALRYISQSESVLPDDVDNLMEKAYSLFLMNDKQGAERILQGALIKYPDLPEAIKIKIKFNLGTYYLYRDDFQTGLKLFLEEGAKLKFWKNDNFIPNSVNNVFEKSNQKLKREKYIKWDGSVVKGKPVVVDVEAGIGDEIINFRFMKYIKELGMVPYWFSSLKEREDLNAVFARHGFNVVEDLSLIKDDTIYYTQSMHLPITLKLEYKDLWYGPYLGADQSYIDKWKWVKGSNKKSIGIRWQGNPEYDQDLHRSYPLKQVLDLFEGKDVDLYSLQKDNGLEEMDSRIHDLSDKLETWDDTLACIENLDYVITSCTSIAHASAAMGKKTIILVPISAYYTWSHSGEQSPWYGDNVILLRQQKPRTWDEPIEKLKSLI